MDNGTELYLQYLDGDDSAFARLLDVYRAPLILYLTGFLCDPERAQEASEDAFFLLAVKRPSFDGESSFKTWLYTIGRNAALSHIRRTKRRREEPLDEKEDPSDVYELEEQVLREERKVLLHRAMRKLPGQYRDVLYLLYFEDFDNAACARVLKKSTRQVEQLSYRAKKALRGILDKEDFPYEE